MSVCYKYRSARACVCLYFVCILFVRIVVVVTLFSSTLLNHGLDGELPRRHAAEPCIARVHYVDVYYKMLVMFP